MGNEDVPDLHQGDEGGEEEISVEEFIADVVDEWRESGVPIQFKKETLTAVRELTDSIRKLTKAINKDNT